jgi:iron complex outermembrane receptor protein
MPALTPPPSAPPSAEVVVTAASPLAGAGVSQTLATSAGLDEAAGPAPLIVALRSAAVTQNDEAGNAYEPTIGFRGFEASPAAGGGQGLAIYLDGGRFNQPFGDTVNLDLAPAEAVRRVSIEEANPSFGLNALGGAVSVALKTGFDERGATLQAVGGGYGWARAALSEGWVSGGQAGFVSLSRSHDDGWRRYSPSDLTQGYASLAWRGPRGYASVSLLGDDNRLAGNGVSPVELLAADWRGVFTRPDTTHNRFVRAQASAGGEVGGVALKTTAYLSRLDQDTQNGDASDAVPCPADAAVLCIDGDVLTDPTGAPIANTLAGRGAGQLNLTQAAITAYGATIEARGTLPGRIAQDWMAGASADGGQTRFSATSLVGALDDGRAFAGPAVSVDQPGGPILPVRVDTTNLYLGVYASDVVRLADRADLTLSGRFNTAQVTLVDRLGTALNGDHRFQRFNPGVRLDVRPARGWTADLGYAEASRAPTPAELSCADAASPCGLANFFIADPDLRQMVARTGYAALAWSGAAGTGRLTARADAYWTETQDEILFVGSPLIGHGFFRNAGSVRRRGLETSADYVLGRLTARVGFSLVDATFRAPLAISSPDNPQADAGGFIHVHPGDRLPGVPRRRLDADLAYGVTDAFTIGAHLTARDGVFLTGDEANLTPTTAGFAVLGLRADWRVGRRLVLFGSVENVADTRYATFGAFSPTDQVFIREAPGGAAPRSLAPGEPRRFQLGLRLSL